MSIRQDKQWRGYTLDEIRVLKAVNQARIEVLTGKLKHSDQAQKEKGWLDRLPEYVLYFKTGMKLYKTVKALFSKS